MNLRFPFGLAGKPRRKPPLDRVRRFMIDYSPPDPGHLEYLSGFDLVILESQLHDRDGIQSLTSAGTIVLGYHSIMEAPRWNRKRFGRLQPDDFLKLGGTTCRIPEWDAFLLDLRQNSCRSLLLDEATDMLEHQGFAGLFLDTVDDLHSDWLDSTLQYEMRNAYQSLVSELRSRYPSAVFVQNRGFGTLRFVMELLDGILWEDWNGLWQSSPWAREQMNLLKAARRKGMTVLTACESDDPVHQYEAKRQGFVHLTRGPRYHERE